MFRREKILITIHSIVYQTEKSVIEPPFRFNRTPLEQAKLIANHGIEGDRKAGSKKRQINIMSLETKQRLAAQGYKTGPGEMGEQITISGLDVSTLKPGDRLQLGSEAVFEVTMQREPCDWFARVQDQPKNVDVGVLGRVLVGGSIAIGDTVQVLTPVGD